LQQTAIDPSDAPITAYDIEKYFLPEKLIPFKELILEQPTQDIRNKSSSACDRTFLLHGMFGLGKTAFSRHLQNELKQKTVYRDGVYFVHCGESSIGKDNMEPVKRLLSLFTGEVTNLSLLSVHVLKNKAAVCALT
jgi:Cdc6-like AAA superfamily ATPase